MKTRLALVASLALAGALSAQRVLRFPVQMSGAAATALEGI